MDFNKYDVIVFDVDGTLYFQNRLRLIMAGRLFRYYFLRPHKIKELFIIKKFRSIKDSVKESDTVYDKTAKELGIPVDEVKEVIQKWIYENPLDAVYMTRDERLISKIKELKNAGKKIVIWSDYFADDKLDKLNIKADAVYTAEDERVGELKPSHKALELIMSDFNTGKDEVLMVGDRDVKDGAAARSAGVDFVILGKTKKSRDIFFK